MTAPRAIALTDTDRELVRQAVFALALTEIDDGWREQLTAAYETQRGVLVREALQYERVRLGDLINAFETQVARIDALLAS
jgi:hypothetical protein